MMATPVKKWLLRVAPWFLPVGIVAVWQLASSVGWLSTRILPSPEGVVMAFWTLSASGELWQNLAISSWACADWFFNWRIAGINSGAD
ncbi:putative aliphatic sulfonates ABC transporter permease [Escherichia coli]|uniref:Putative aliphatic sulfonates ABC transporter permease n=1 Tax=Escherichia coli TaxID=562 RepID=A0A376W0K5_ECOLX|nr:putative aliphatic sulfonates ABC transporter permease [Escherichia coli]